MSKSSKAKVRKRIQEVLTLLLAGAEAANVKQYADQNGWKVSERQLRRYVKAANDEFARAAQGNRQVNLGRHLRQRRYISARALKDGDLRTALLASRDEAKLEGIYQPPEGAVKGGGPPRPAPLACDERLRRYVGARYTGNAHEMDFMEKITPKSMYALTDLMLAELMLHILTMAHVTKQLESAAWFAMTRMIILDSPEPRVELGLMWAAHGYVFKVRDAGWKLFTRNIGINGDCLIRDNYLGDFLGLFSQQICDRALTEEELQEEFAAFGIKPPKLLKIEDVAEEYQSVMRPLFEL